MYKREKEARSKQDFYCYKRTEYFLNPFVLNTLENSESVFKNTYLL